MPPGVPLPRRSLPNARASKRTIPERDNVSVCLPKLLDSTNAVPPVVLDYPPIPSLVRSGIPNAAIRRAASEPVCPRSIAARPTSAPAGSIRPTRSAHRPPGNSAAPSSKPAAASTAAATPSAMAVRWTIASVVRQRRRAQVATPAMTIAVMWARLAAAAGPTKTTAPTSLPAGAARRETARPQRTAPARPNASPGSVNR